MKIKGQVVDDKTKEPLPGTSILVVDSDGNLLGPGSAADDQGGFILDSPLLDDLNNYVLISNVEYESIFIDPDLLTGVTGGVIYMKVLPDELQSVTVRPTEKKKSKAWIWIAIGTMLLLASKEKKKGKTIGELGQIHWEDLAIKAGLAIGAYYGIVVPILVKLGILDSEDEKKAKANAKKAADAQKELSGETAPQSSFTYQKGTLTSMVDQLNSATKSIWGYDYLAITKWLPYAAGFRNADARYFLGQFANTANQSFYQWWFNKFEDAQNFSDPLWIAFNTDKAIWAKWGIHQSDENGEVANLGWDEIVKKVVDYVYTVAGIDEE